MDTKFHPAIGAIKAGDIDALKRLLADDPTLATSRSSKSHPTLLQCLTLDARDVPNKIDMAKLLVDAGAEINGPLMACASINNVEVADYLLDVGADINGAGDWSPLEEALYWGNNDVRDILLERGASVHNLRLAAGLGRIDLMEGFFDNSGSLKPEAGEIHWPFEDPLSSNAPRPVSVEPAYGVASSTSQSRDIINNALVYACRHGQIEAAGLLLRKGADINCIPRGFHYPGTPLHNAAVSGHRSMVEFLIEHGANPESKDAKGGGAPANWAEYAGHLELKRYLDQIAEAKTN